MSWAHSFGNIFQGRKTERETLEGRGREEMLLHPLPDKQKLRAFTGVEWGSGGERTLEERGGREGGRGHRSMLLSSRLISVSFKHQCVFNSYNVCKLLPNE